jgi:hypothetical protein
MPRFSNHGLSKESYELYQFLKAIGKDHIFKVEVMKFPDGRTHYKQLLDINGKLHQIEDYTYLSEAAKSKQIRTRKTILKPNKILQENMPVIFVVHGDVDDNAAENIKSDYNKFGVRSIIIKELSDILECKNHSLIDSIRIKHLLKLPNPLWFLDSVPDFRELVK